MKTTSIVFEQNLDGETLEEFASLRLIRLGLAERQLANLEETLDNLISRGLLDPKLRDASRAELKTELATKIQTLRLRNSEAPEIVFLDEVEFYLDVIGER